MLPPSYKVLFHPEARQELAQLPVAERLAISTAIENLMIEGPRLRYPHQSNVRGVRGLRELRPRAGRSIWRPLYSQVSEETFVVCAIAPEARRDRRGFSRAVKSAQRGLEEVL